jgi:transposase
MKILSAAEELELRRRHRIERDGRIRDRIKAILLSNEGWTYQTIAAALMIDPQSVSRFVDEYKASQKLKPENGGSSPKLTTDQAKTLIAHLEEKLYTCIRDICVYVLETYGVSYTIPGMRSWMGHHGFVYKKPKGIPAKADEAAQAAFIKSYNTLLNTTPEDEPILFGDSVHPTQATTFSCGWIRRGKEQYIPTTGARARLNITGAINLETMAVHSGEFDQITGASFVQFLTDLETKSYPSAPKIHLIVDRGSCHRCAEVKNYLAARSRVVLHFLPPYSPNLNPIERLWKVTHELTTHNKFYATKKEFFAAIRMFFTKTVHEIKTLLQSRVTDSFDPLK